MNSIVLRVRGVTYSGWTSVNIKRSLDQMAGSFSFTAADRYLKDPSKWGIQMGDECVVELNGDLLITGYIEEISTTYGKDNHSISFSGRDKLGDLLDCSYVKADGEKGWKQVRMHWILDDLCSQFGIDVVVDTSAVVQANEEMDYAPDGGTPIANIINELCGVKAVLAVTYGDGKLLLTRAGDVDAHDSLEAGVNILSADMISSNLDRYSLYIVKGQGTGTDTKKLPDFVQPSGQLEDEDIDRYRPLIVLADAEVTNQRCSDLAAWEARVRAGKSRAMEYTVQGFTQSNGDAWPLNALVMVNDPYLGVHGKMLINSVEFRFDDSSGSTTKLGVIHKGAYSLISSPVKGMKLGFDPQTMRSTPL